MLLPRVATGIISRLMDLRAHQSAECGEHLSIAEICLGVPHSLGNDAQKTMGIVAVLLFSQGRLGSNFLCPVLGGDYVPGGNGLGTLVGGWRIVHTFGSKITRLMPLQGFCASTGGANMLFAATYLGVPVSTTHTVTGSVMGVAAARKVSAVPGTLRPTS